MDFVENNGKKVAAILCVASSFPVVATVYAMETQPGWHGDKYVKEDATIAKGWEEIEGKSYYFSETDGTVDVETTKNSVVATVSSQVSNNLQQTVTEQAKTAVQEKVEWIEKEKQDNLQIQEMNVEQTPVVPETNEPIIEEVVTPEVNQPIVETPVVPEVDAPIINTPEVPEPEVNTPVVPEIPEPEVNAPVVPDTNVDENIDENVVVPTPTPDPDPILPDVTDPEENQGTTDVANPYAELNARIAQEAKKLVGTTNGMWCTQVVKLALANAGVSDAAQLWPDQYFKYGYETSDPQPGNLVYYNNGGRGVDHIAIYIGDGLCVHGNFRMSDGSIQTVISSVYNGGGGTPQFIQVTR